MDTLENSLHNELKKVDEPEVKIISKSSKFEPGSTRYKQFEFPLNSRNKDAIKYPLF